MTVVPCIQCGLLALVATSGGHVRPVASPTTVAEMTPGQRLTYEQEGERLTPYHPTPGSGVTIGVGYDLRERTKAGVLADMTAAGVPNATAEALASAAGLSGKPADEFVAKHPSLSITREQSETLFASVYEAKAAYARHLATKPDVVKEYGETDWDKLDQGIKDVLIDMTFRGDYTPAVREHIQKHVVASDRAGFKKAISAKSTFPSNLSQRRFQARIDHL